MIQQFSLSRDIRGEGDVLNSGLEGGQQEKGEPESDLPLRVTLNSCCSHVTENFAC